MCFAHFWNIYTSIQCFMWVNMFYFQWKRNKHFNTNLLTPCNNWTSETSKCWPLPSGFCNCTPASWATLLDRRSNTESPSLFDSQTAELRVVGGKTRSGAGELETCFVGFRTAFSPTIDTTHCPLVQCVWSAGRLERSISVRDPVEWSSFRTSSQRRRKRGKKRRTPAVSASDMKRNFTQTILTIQLLMKWLENLFLSAVAAVKHPCRLS